MSTTARRLARSLMVMLSIAAVGAGLAWACTENAELTPLPPGSAVQPGGAVVVSGRAFPSHGTVEVRWNSVQGPLLATAETTGSGAFEVEVTVPDAAPDTHKILARGLLNGEVQADRAIPVQVVRSSPNGADGTAATTNGGDTARGGGRTAGTASGAEGDSAAAPAGTRATATTRGTENGRSPRQGSSESGRTTDRSAESPVRPVPSPAIATDSGRRVFADSVAAQPAGDGRAGGVAVRSPAPPAAGVAPSQRAPSERSASSDLWSGFGATGDRPAAPPVADVVAPGGSDPRLPLGLALFGLGVSVVAAGSLVAAARRRRTAAASRGSRKLG